MKLWLDDVRPAPEGWVWKKSAKEALDAFRFSRDVSVGVEMWAKFSSYVITEASLDHDLGGAPSKLYNWLAPTGYMLALQMAQEKLHPT